MKDTKKLDILQEEDLRVGVGIGLKEEQCSILIYVPIYTYIYIYIVQGKYILIYVQCIRVNIYF